MKKIIETERLYFRELAESDDVGMFSLDSDPEVHEFLGKKPIQSIEEAREVIRFIRQQYTDNGIARWAIVEKESNSFIGWGAFKFVKEPINGHVDFYDLGYRFIKSAWGKGYATESSKAAIAYAFDELKLTVIYAYADHRNLGSQSVLKKCGFIEKGIFDDEGDPHFWFELRNPHS